MRLRLSDLAINQKAVIDELFGLDMANTTRLRDLGFVPGEPVRVIARAAFNGPLAIRISSSTFSLRQEETNLIWVRTES